MKKAILTFGLFSMMMILTSFTSNSEIGGQSVPGSSKPLQYEIGGQSVPGSSKPLQYEIGGQRVPTDKNPLGIGGQKVPESSTKPFTVQIGGQSVPGSRPLA